MLAILAHCLACPLSPLYSQSPDTAASFKLARRAEIEYEASIRHFAPLVFASRLGRDCDERVGRWCIYYETGHDSLPPEPIAVGLARAKAIDALQHAFVLAPARVAIASPLVRLLVGAARPDEAVEIARPHARASGNLPEAKMLLGFALHAARQTEAAIAEFEQWLAALPVRERERITKLDWLLDPRERRRYRRLSPPQRDAYERRVWRLADPLYSTSGNEVWSDHLARHALARMLAARPPIPNGEIWGSDLEELTVRYGGMVLTTRAPASSAMGAPYVYTEHWDPTQRTYVPPRPDSAFRAPARLDTIWPLDTLNVRSGHAPPTIRGMRVLLHEAAVFPDRQPSLVISGWAAIDTSVAAAGAVYLLDSAFNVIAHAPAQVHVTGDSAVFSAELPIPPGARFYSAELYDAGTRFAARARHPIMRPARSEWLELSGLILADAFPAGELPTSRSSVRALTRPAVLVGNTFGVYAELRSGIPALERVRVELEATNVDRPSVLSRIAGWVGRRGVKPAARIGWDVELKPEATPIAVTLDLGDVPPGRYRITVTVHDPGAESRVVAVREVLIVKRVTDGGQPRP